MRIIWKTVFHFIYALETVDIISTNFEQYLQDVPRSEKALPANAGTSRQYGLTDINDHSEAFVMRFALAACIKPII